MNLLDIKNYLIQVKMASLSHLCAYFKCDAELLRCMMGHWVRKGCVRQCAKTPRCGTRCAKCPIAETEIYEWVYSKSA